MLSNRLVAPSPEEIKRFRGAIGITQSNAASLVHCTLSAWQRWEQGERKMHPGLWELFQIKNQGNIGMITKKMAAWLMGDDTGLSSKCIWGHMTGVGIVDDELWAPADPSDFGRCARLLELFPEWKPRIVEMAQYGQEWANLSARWNEIHLQMEEEVGIDWSKGRKAPKTFQLMQKIAGETK